jgi:glycosyltransferase involved in cell wall biosynthesis
MTPTVSIVLPTFNRTEYLRAAVQSVFAQSFPDWELIVADDGSADETRGFLRGLTDPRVRTLWLRHAGNPSVARNAALTEARGAYLAFLDSDDLWMESKLAVQLAAMRAHPERRWSYTAAQRIDPDGQPVADAVPFVAHEGDIFHALLQITAYIALPTVVAERRLVVDAGGFDEAQRFGEDYDLWLRLAARSPVVAVDQRLARVRLHAANYSHDRFGFYEGWLRLYTKTAATASDAKTQAICRRKIAELSIGLANFHVDAGDAVAALRVLLRGWRSGAGHVSWWSGATKALVRSALPPSARAAYRRLRAGPHAARPPQPR